MKLVWKLIALACVVMALAAAACAEGVLNLPSNTRTIEEEAFYGLQGVDRVNLPNNVRYIGPRAFGNSSVREIRVPTSRDLRIANDALDGSPNAKIISDDALWYGVFKYAVDDDHIVIKGYLGASPTMTIPAEIDGKPVTHIAKNAFNGRQDITSVVIPASVTSIGETAFYDCYALEQADIPASVTEIGNKAFGYNRALTSMSIPEGITAIPTDLFYGCNSLVSVHLPSTVTAIGDYAFGSCTKLTTVNFPNGLTAIGKQAFDSSCRNQEGYPVYELPDTLETVGEGAFTGCGAALCVTRDGEQEALLKERGWTLTYYDRKDYRYQYRKQDDVYQLVLTAYTGAGGNVVIPEGPVMIGEYAFAGNTAVTGVTIPAGVTSVDRWAFDGCTNLASAVIPAGVTALRDGAFHNCEKLVDVTFPQSLTAIGSDAFKKACYGQEGTHFFNLPDHIATLGWAPFNDCGAVLCFNRGSDSATLFRSKQYVYTYTGETDFRFRWYNNEGNGLERLVQYTGSAQSVTIPNHVWLVDADAFRDNNTITKVVIPEGVTHIYREAFRDCVNLTDITLPSTLTMMEDSVFYNCGSASTTDFMVTLPSGISNIYRYVFDSSRMILVCDINSTTANTISGRGYSFVRSDLTNKPEFRFRWDYFDHVWGWGLYDYVGTASSVRLPDDCVNVNSEKFRNRPELELVCGQLSDTAGGLSRAGLNFTFPGHEGMRYRVIDGILYVMGYAGTGNQIIIPKATTYIDAGWDERIRANAFKDKQNVTKVVIPEGVTRIDSDAFTNCYKLTDITFPDSLKYINQNAFLWCGKDVAQPFYFLLPDNLDDMVSRGGGATTFSDCNAILVCGKTSQTAALLTDRNYVYTCPGEYDYRYRYEKYTDGEETGRRLWLVGYVGEGATAEIPEGIYGIKLFSSDTESTYYRTFYGYGFNGNETVTKVVIPEGTVRIDSDVFTNCYNLTDITLPSTLKSLDQNVFRYCGRDADKVFYLTLPNNMEVMAGRGGGAQTFSDFNGILETGKYSKTAELLTDKNFCYTVKGEHDFRYRYRSHDEDGQQVRRLWLVGYAGTSIQVDIPAGIYGIDRYQWDPPYGEVEPGFTGRNDITKVVIPEGTEVIEDSVFYGCTNLTDITFPSTLKVLKNHAFERCGMGAQFRHYYVLPSDMTEIAAGGWGAFNDLNLGTLVCVHDSYTARLLSGCYDTRYHAGYSFAISGRQMDGLIYRYRTDTVDEAYLHRLILTEYVGSSSSVVIPGGYGIYGIANGVFQDKANISEIVIPDGIVEIGDNAFNGCVTLHGGSVIDDDWVKDLPEGTELDVIKLPNTLKTLGNSGFKDVGSAVTSRFYLVLPASLENFDVNTISGCNAVFVAPMGSNAASALYMGWYRFYYTLEDAVKQQNPQFKIDPDNPQHQYFGRE